MTNLQERMSPDPVGNKPMATDHQSDKHLNEPPRPMTVVIIGDLILYFFYFCTKYRQIPLSRPSLGWPKCGHISVAILMLNME